MERFSLIWHVTLFIVLVSVTVNCNLEEEGSGKDSNETFGEITLPIPNFTGASYVFLSRIYYTLALKQNIKLEYVN